MNKIKRLKKEYLENFLSIKKKKKNAILNNLRATII